MSDEPRRWEIVEAALAVGLSGDLDPAISLLSALGVTVEHDGMRHIAWNDAPGVPSGGLGADADPVGALVILLFAAVGPLWPLVPITHTMMADVRLAYRDDARRRRLDRLRQSVLPLEAAS